MGTVCIKDMCTGCMACIDVCTHNAIKIDDNLKAYNAVIDESKCIHCSACKRVCQCNNSIKANQIVKWYQGWAENQKIREKVSSGGVATEFMRAFVKQGGCVFSCVFSFGEFRFEVAETQNEVNKFSGSKYVKSNPEGIYKQVYERLRNNRKVLFIGLPCQVAAVKNYIGETRIENLYTVDLICHGTPSPKLFDIFLKQYGYNLSTLEHIGFRAKTIYQVSINQKNIGVPSTCDKYTISFLNSISFTENCYSCKYAKKERVSDITLGDSWGSELSDEIQKKGVSLILCQTNKGKELLDMSKLYLESVNLEKAIQSNHQLVHPSIKPEKRTLFFKIIKKGKSFNKAVQRCYPKICFKQFVKSTLIKISNFFCSFV